ncbi:MAG: caspase family protein [bacterium]|nr:caspase family protein [bacterium]
MSLRKHVNRPPLLRWLALAIVVPSITGCLSRYLTAVESATPRVVVRTAPTRQHLEVTLDQVNLPIEPEDRLENLTFRYLGLGLLGLTSLATPPTALAYGLWLVGGTAVDLVWGTGLILRQLGERLTGHHRRIRVSLLDPPTRRVLAATDLDEGQRVEWPWPRSASRDGLMIQTRWVRREGDGDRTLAELHGVTLDPSQIPVRPLNGVFPLLATNLTFRDPRGEGALVAEQGGILDITVQNTGTGKAEHLVATLSSRSPADLGLPASLDLGVLEPGASRTVSVPVPADLNLPDGQATFRVEVEDVSGVDAAPHELSVATRKRRYPDLVLERSGASDPHDGILRTGEQLTLALAIRNRGLVPAERTRVDLHLPAHVLLIDPGNLPDLGTVPAGGIVVATCSILVNNRYAGPAPVPLEATLTERRAEARRVVRFPLALGERATPLQTAVAARPIRGPEWQPVPELTIDVDLPLARAVPVDREAVALVIGVERFLGAVPTVPHAARDAHVMKDLLVKAFGVPEEHLLFLIDERASLAALRTALEGQLPDRVTRGRSKVFVYYAGHGAPDIEAGAPYLVPHDGNPDYPGTSCLRLDELYDALGDLGAREVTVLLDACFTGQAGRQERPVSLLAGARPIRLSPRPAALPAGIRVFAASSGEQLSLDWPEKRHGLFTYFLLKALRERVEHGQAIDWGAVQTTVAAQVEKQARRQGRKQTPVWLEGGP